MGRAHIPVPKERLAAFCRRHHIQRRNRLIHGYDFVDIDILWQTISDDLPPLISFLERIVVPAER